MKAPLPISRDKVIERMVLLQHRLEADGFYVDSNTVALAVDDLKGAGLAWERLQAIIDWGNLALSHPEEFSKHGVKNLDGPVFDEARVLLAKGARP